MSVLLASPSAQQTKKRLLKSMKTMYLFHITQEQKGVERSWFVDMKVRDREGMRASQRADHYFKIRRRAESDCLRGRRRLRASQM